MSPEEFAKEFGPEFVPNQTAHTHNVGPYGAPAQPIKPGLTKRGKAALTIGAAVLAGGGILAWQDYNADAKASEIQAQELQYKRDLLALQMQKELNKANAAAKKTEAAENSERNKLVDECVASNKKMVGKLMGVTYQSVRGDCEDQYPTTTTAGDMQAAATAQDTASSSNGGVNTGLLIGAGALGLGLVVFAKKSTKSSQS